MLGLTMKRHALPVLLSIVAASGTARADEYRCPAIGSVCSHSINVATAIVGPDGIGQRANAAVLPQKSAGPNAGCRFEGAYGIRQRRLPISNTGAAATVTFVKSFRIRARAQTGSGGQAVGTTAFVACDFRADVTLLPNNTNPR
jgi:hypothetical protein